MSARAVVAVPIFCLLLALPAAVPARAQQAADPLQGFLHGLADSTDAYFGRTAVEFDTTGLDSLIRIGGDPSLLAATPRQRVTGSSYSPSARYHRAEGAVLGLGVRTGSASWGHLGVRGSYGFANREGRYDVGYERDLWRDADVARRHLTASVRYARETLPFAPEHAEPRVSAIGAAFTALDRQSVFERRGAEGSLRLIVTSFDIGAGARDARDQSMPLVTRRSVWGPRPAAKDVTAALEDQYLEVFGHAIARWPGGDQHAGIQAQGGETDRWRLRASAARTTRLGRFVKLLTQAEAGSTTRRSPPQLRFELGGPRAVPSLGFGKAAGNRLLLGKVELIAAMDVLQRLRLPYASLFAVHPAIFGHAGAAWDGPTSLREKPPRSAWNGSAGVALVSMPGIPDSATFIRLQFAWPVGRDSGVPRLSLSLGAWMDLVSSP